MTKETKELVRLLIITLVVMMAIPLAYRVYVSLYPPENNPRQTLAQFLEETRSERALKLLTTPHAKWTEADVKSEPEVYAWLKKQGNEILPWDWTEEARRKDPKGYEKCWRRIWEELKAHCEERLSLHQKEDRRLEREREVLTVLHMHRTNQIARLRAFISTNTFPCKVTLEHLEKGRFWGWNKKAEMVVCQDAEALLADKNGVLPKEESLAAKEQASILALQREREDEAKLIQRIAPFQALINECLSAARTNLPQNSLLIHQRKLLETIKALGE